MAQIIDDRLDSSPTSILLVGSNDAFVAAITEILKPDFIVISAVPTIPAAVEYLSAAFSDFDDTSGRPQIVLVGGAFTDADFETLSKVALGAVAWMRPEEARPGTTLQKPTGPVAPEVVAGRIRRCVDKGGYEIKSEVGWGTVFWF